MTQSKQEVSRPATALKKEIGLWGLVALGVGGIIGSGVFGLPATMGSVAGPALVLAVVLVGAITTLLALIYAELGSAFPVTGGPYSIPRMALGDSGGFVIGWGYFLYAFTGTAAIIDIMVTYAGFYIPGLSVGLTLTSAGIVLAVAATIAFTVINILGVRWGTYFGLLTTVAKLVPLLLFGVIGLALLHPSNFSPFLPFGLSGVGLAMAFGFFSFTGFEAVVIPSGEVKSPSKTIPRAMIITMAVVVAVYILIAVAFAGLINWQGLGLTTGDWANISNLSSPLSNVATAAGLGLLATVVAIGAIISTVGAGGDWVLFQARIPYAMAQDKLFWGPMDKVHRRFSTPYIALIFASALTVVTQVLVPSFPDVVLIASITTLIPYAAAALSLPILRKTKPDVARPYRLPFGIVLAAAGFVLATILVYWASWPWTLVGAVATIIGFPLYMTTGKHKLDLKRQAWLVVYIVGLAVISLLGDTNFVYENFNNFISPLGIIVMPYDLIVLTIFALGIFAWAYKANTSAEIEKS
ncbi:MAG TPA: APC family permease [Nitrososphaerales archaeon]|nr:APC family permease [Nitrososphaerales archaeon]